MDVQHLEGFRSKTLVKTLVQIDDLSQLTISNVFFHLNIGGKGFVYPASARVWPRLRFTEPLPPVLREKLSHIMPTKSSARRSLTDGNNKEAHSLLIYIF